MMGSVNQTRTCVIFSFCFWAAPFTERMSHSANFWVWEEAVPVIWRLKLVFLLFDCALSALTAGFFSGAGDPKRHLQSLKLCKAMNKLCHHAVWQLSIPWNKAKNAINSYPDVVCRGVKIEIQNQNNGFKKWKALALRGSSSGNVQGGVICWLITLTGSYSLCNCNPWKSRQQQILTIHSKCHGRAWTLGPTPLHLIVLLTEGVTILHISAITLQFFVRGVQLTSAWLR